MEVHLDDYWPMMATPSPFTALLELPNHAPYGNLIKFIEENADKWDQFIFADQKRVNDASATVKKWQTNSTSAIGDIIGSICKNIENGQNESKSVDQPKTNSSPFTDLTEQLQKIVQLFDELTGVIVANMNGWETLSVEDQKKISSANKVLNDWEYNGFSAIVVVMCAMLPYETKGEKQESKCVEFALLHYPRYELAKQILSGLAGKHKKAFIPHIETMFQMVEKIMKTNIPPTSNIRTGEPESFIRIFLRLLPVLVAGCDTKYKYQIYRMLSQIIDDSKHYIRNEELTPIWNCLEIGITKADSYTKCDAFDTLICYASFLEKSTIRSGHTAVIYKSLLELLEEYCAGHSTGVIHLKQGNEKRLLDAFRFFCKLLGAEYLKLPSTMERLLESLNPSESVRTNPLVIGFIDAVFENADEKMEPHLPQLTEKLTTFLTKIASEGIKVYSTAELAEVAEAIGNGKFMRFFVTIAFKLLQKSDDHEFRAIMYALFDAIVLQKRKIELDAFLPKLAVRLTSSAKLKEAEATANVLVEKKQAIKSLNVMASHTGKDFSPYIHLSFEAVYGQLHHSDDSIRQISIETLTQFVVSFFRLGKVERSQQMAAKIIPEFAKMLKTNKLIIAVSIVGSYQSLLSESEKIFAGEIKLVDKLIDCVNDILGEKLACQANFESIDDMHTHSSGRDVAVVQNQMKLTEAAIFVFSKLGKLKPTSEFTPYFESMLPILVKKLERTRYTYGVKFRASIFYAFSESIRAMKANVSTSFDILYPLLLSGMRPQYYIDRRNISERLNAAIALGELMTNAKEKAKEKSVEFARAFFRFWDEKTIPKVDEETCGLVLPILIGKLKDADFENQQEATFKHFLAFLNENNRVFLIMLHSIVPVALELLSRELGQAARKAIVAFLKEYRKQFGHIFEITFEDVLQQDADRVEN